MPTSQTKSLQWPHGYLIFGILTIGLLLRVIFFNGAAGSDDARYYEFARQIIQDGKVSTLDHAASRVFFLLIVCGPGVLAGSFKLACATNLVLSVLADFLIVAWLYKRNRNAALLMAIFCSFNGLKITYSSMICPEPLLQLMLFGAIALVNAGRELIAPRSMAASLAGGVLAGLAYGAKDTGILLLPPLFLVIMTMYRRHTMPALFKCLALFVLGFVLVWFAEGALLQRYTGDFLFKVHAISKVHNASMTPAANVAEFLKGGYWNGVSVLGHPVQLVLPLAIGVAGAIISVVHWLRKRSCEPAVFGLTAGFVLLYTVMGSSSFTRLINLPIQDRYFLPMETLLLAPGLLLLLPYLERMKAGSKAGLLLAAGILLSTSGVLTSARESGRLYFTEDLHNAAAAIDSIPSDTAPVILDADVCKRIRDFLPAATLKRLQCLKSLKDREPKLDEYAVIPTRGLLAEVTRSGLAEETASWSKIARITPKEAWGLKMLVSDSAERKQVECLVLFSGSEQKMISDGN